MSDVFSAVPGCFTANDVKDSTQADYTADAVFSAVLAGLTASDVKPAMLTVLMTKRI